MVTGGLRSKISAIMEINKCSEEEAKKELEKIAGDNQITGKEIDWMNDDNSKEDERQDKQEHSEEKEDM